MLLFPTSELLMFNLKFLQVFLIFLIIFLQFLQLLCLLLPCLFFSGETLFKSDIFIFPHPEIFHKSLDLPLIINSITQFCQSFALVLVFGLKLLYFLFKLIFLFNCILKLILQSDNVTGLFEVIILGLEFIKLVLIVF